jgi:hypothetical protein
MSFRRALWAFAIVVCLAAPIAVKAQGDYLDVFVVKVKPDKVADFMAVTKKWVDANRRFNGDHWIAMETVYGDPYVYQMTSTRADYADADKSSNAGMAAANKAFGKDGALKLLQDFNNCVVSSRAELRRRRWDLSRKPPTDADAYAQFIGQSRFLRTTAVHVRPGHTSDFEALLKELKEGTEKNPDVAPLFVSQVVEGGKGATFYLSSLRPSMGGFDHNPVLKDILGEEAFKKMQQMVADSYETSESTLYRFNAELSNPPEAVAKVAMDFWHPKALVASAAKPKPATAEAAASAKDATKKQ